MAGRYCLTALFVLLLMVSPAQGELRQWTDENGVKHFSNKEKLPAGVSVEKSFEEKESAPVEPHQYRRAVPTVRPQSDTDRAFPDGEDPNKAAMRKKLRSSEARAREVFDRIYTKRRYVKRSGKQDIESIRRLNGEIQELEKSGADATKLKMLEAERDAARRRLFNENLRTRKGVGDDITKYKEIVEEITILKKSL